MSKSVQDISVQQKIIINEQLLNSIREIRQLQSKIQLEIGSLEAQKHLALHKLHAQSEDLKAIMVEIEKEHGKGTINLDTGELVLDTAQNGNS